jgi:D-serine deaminase-like pyridoxal phosphate-dependent protein
MHGSNMAKTPASNPHDAYFSALEAALKAEGLLRPTLVIDQDRLAQNTVTVLAHLPPGMGLRLVVKSLPSVPLIREVMSQAKTSNLMVFDLPFLSAIAREIPQADVLFGKPMPVGLAAKFYDEFKGAPRTDFDPARQVQWLIDTPERLAAYAKLAEERDLHLKVNIEIDVGLHRGGVAGRKALAAMLDAIDANPRLTFSGLMGYDAHVSKLPGFMRGRALRKSRALYEDLRGLAEERYPARKSELTFNTAGSPTYQLHKDLNAGTEVALGSGLVKPLDFDIGSLDDHAPACFIATPVLKAEKTALLPGLEAVSKLARVFNPKAAKAFFIYGGNWLAQPVSPPGLRQNKLYGRSSNEEMLNGKAALKPDDLVFLRPTQSEAVFLQFGDIAVYRGGKITQFWPVIGEEPKRLRSPVPKPAAG